MTGADVVVSPQGTIWLFHLLSRRAERWVDANVQPDCHWFAGALVVEHRFADDLARGMNEDGLRVRITRSGDY